MFRCLLLLALPVVFGTETPIIGVLGVPLSEGCSTLDSSSSARSCFNSYYVKWLEAAGAQVVPVHHDTTEDELDHLAKSVNGFLFTGGGIDLSVPSPYRDTALGIFNRVQTSHGDGKLSLWGSCMGFQLLCILAANNSNVLSSGFDSENLSLALELLPGAEKTALWHGLDETTRWTLTHENVTSNLHHDGVTPDAYNQNERLNNFFVAVSENHDRQGRAFISAVEAREHAIFATQWHPERPQFEWVPGRGINHDSAAIAAMQAVADFFVNQARNNTNSFTNATELQARLIYNYAPENRGFGSQVYLF